MAASIKSAVSKTRTAIRTASPEVIGRFVLAKAPVLFRFTWPVVLASGGPVLALLAILALRSGGFPHAQGRSPLNHAMSYPSANAAVADAGDLAMPGLAAPNTSLDSLDPVFQTEVIVLLRQLRELGFEFDIIETHRSAERQHQLWQQGRDPSKPGRIITHASSGQSFHERGLAIDLAPRMNGRVQLDTRHPEVREAFEALGRHAKALGLRWGGDWSLADWGHVEQPTPHSNTANGS